MSCGSKIAGDGMAGASGPLLEPPETRGPWAWPGVLARWLFRAGLDSGRGSAHAEPVSRFRTVCVSREAGAGGGAIARLVGTRLNWKVYDHELLEAIAQGMEVPADEARPYDELAPGLVQDWLLPLREEHYAPQEAYLDHLAKLVESIGRAGDSVIVGRGAGQLLPRSETLCVRVVAPLKMRARNLAASMGVSQRTARKAATDRDRRVAKFVRALHRVEIDDPHLYDLVLDSHALGLTIASELIVRVGRDGPAAEGREFFGDDLTPRGRFVYPPETRSASLPADPPTARTRRGRPCASSSRRANPAATSTRPTLRARSTRKGPTPRS